MPIYEYKCLQCGEVFEAFQKITDQPLTECRTCHGKVEKLISHTSFQLKGSGWYLTDYARKSQPSHTSVTDTTKASDKPSATSDGTSSGSSKTENNST